MSRDAEKRVKRGGAEFAESRNLVTVAMRVWPVEKSTVVKPGRSLTYLDRNCLWIKRGDKATIGGSIYTLAALLTYLNDQSQPVQEESRVRFLHQVSRL